MNRTLNLARLSACLTALAIAGTAAAAGDASGLPMWEIQGQSNRVFMLGSIHLLREEDHPLPAEIYEAYAEAETLIMELDMDDIDPVATQALTTELGLIEGDATLADVLGPDAYAEATRLAGLAEIPLHLLDRAEPWFAAMNVEMMLLMRMGFNPELGVESHIMNWAKADAKEILGFETMQQQLEFLDSLSADAQREMFLQALSEGPELRETMDELIDAWKTGDTEFLESGMLVEMQAYPELNQAIVVNRNMDWTNQIEALLDDTDDYFIVVGALHLVGDEGVPELLLDRGHSVRQLRQQTAP